MTKFDLNPRIQRVLAQTDYVVGQEFLEKMAVAFSRELGMRWVLIGRSVDQDVNQIQTLVFVEDGQTQENFIYEVAHTPCEDVVSSRSVFIPADAKARYPNSALLKELGVETYLGALLQDGNADTIGVMVAMGDQPKGLQDDDGADLHALFRLFSGRVGAELRRLQDEEDQRSREGAVARDHHLRALGNLASGVAHDFNNILAIVKSNVENAQDLAGGNVELLRSQYDILLAVARGQELVQQIVDYSRSQPRQVEVVDLGELVSEAVSMLEPVLADRISFRQNLKAGLFVKVNPTSIHQVVINLCTNASQAIETKGTIDVELASSGGALGQAILLITDNGVGISPEHLSQVFEPFFTTKSEGAGSGMGLAVVQGIMRQHGGQASVTSQFGQGTTFTLSFPRAEQQTQEVATSAPAQRAMPGPKACLNANCKIMLVDDEPLLLKAQGKALRRTGYRVDTFLDPRDALQAFAENPNLYRLVITDLSMPGISGLRLAQEFQKIAPYQAVLLSTGRGDGISEMQLKEHGVAALLHKPVSLQVLLQQVAIHTCRNCAVVDL